MRRVQPASDGRGTCGVKEDDSKKRGTLPKYSLLRFFTPISPECIHIKYMHDKARGLWHLYSICMSRLSTVTCQRGACHQHVQIFIPAMSVLTVACETCPLCMCKTTDQELTDPSVFPSVNSTDSMLFSMSLLHCYKTEGEIPVHTHDDAGRQRSTTGKYFSVCERFLTFPEFSRDILHGKTKIASAG